MERRSGVANPMIALKRWVKRLAPEGAGAEAPAPLDVEVAAGSSLLRKRDIRPVAAAAGTFGVHSGGSLSPNVSCIVDIERIRSDRSSSVAGDDGVRGDPVSSVGSKVSGREAACECVVWREWSTRSTRDGPLLGPADGGGECMLSSSRGSRGSEEESVRRSNSISSACESLRRLGAARLCWLELERSRLLTWSLPPWRKVEMRRRSPGRWRGGICWRGEVGDAASRVGVEEELPMVGEVGLERARQATRGLLGWC